ncbi:extracellular solute-binding protein [Thalassococcus lentus]|uniref:Extracellular solute-binding protein n=1 Tax=Thalassococcus lentus TaxID=1210524 RepID=A0ABT4XQT8_9RHOB|nr:extracellular solute-binding protein [Thalassococcus lentus]MDA7424319.1 extracellular solute-binding protein [Thalassococcus lentus]
MSIDYFQIPRQFLNPLGAAILSVAVLGSTAHADKAHGIAMYGAPQLPPDFVSLPYVNPQAPKGGRIVIGERGGFDSLNPFVRKGTAPWQLRFSGTIGFESLMGRSWDEPFTLYCLLCESIDASDDRKTVTFTLRDEARFSDGSPVTVEDVMWSYETLGTVGHPRYHNLWKNIASMEQTGPRSVTFTFDSDDRELALLVGMRPVLKKAHYDGIDFAESGTDVAPITSAPYVIEDFEAGRFISLKRNPDYWGWDQPFMQGQANLDEIRIEYFSDGTAQFEAFKSGALNTNREFNAEKWETQYDFPAIDRGDVIKSVLPHQRPSGITGFVMNTRRDFFADWRVRDAMLHAFNFEFINETMTGGRQPRITSYFSNSPLAMSDGPAEGLVRELLEPFAAELPEGVLEGYTLPESDGSLRNRANIAKAADMLAEAGWTVQDGVLKDANGKPFVFSILLTQGSAEEGSIADLYVQALERLGMQVTIETVDSAQFKERTNTFDFDMTWYRRGVSLSPGNEQKKYWGIEAADTETSRNWMGMKSPAAEAMIDAMLTAGTRDEFLSAVKALDRVLTAGRYVIPTYQYNISRIAHTKELKFAEPLPIYGDWINWQTDTWYWED